MTTAHEKVAVVTGGGRGIGLGIARALVADGWTLAIADIAAPDPAVLAELRAGGTAVEHFPLDLADTDSHAAVVAAITARFGAIHCLVNNAGIASPVRGDFLDLAPENFDRVQAVNLKGTVFFTQAVARAMLAAPAAPDAPARGIITITSVSAAMTSPERLDYCIAKAGLSAFVAGLAVRLAPEGIAAFEVRPGIIATDMTSAVTAKYDDLIASGLVPSGRWGQPADIGGMVAALASGRFGFATGSILAADGGLSIARL